MFFYCVCVLYNRLYLALYLFSDMVSNKITLISEIDQNSLDFTIKVRLIRLWHFMDSQKKNEVYSIEMILLDEQVHKRISLQFFI